MDVLTAHFSFHESELSIIAPTKSYRIRGWPEPRTLEKFGDSDWENCQPEFRLVKPEPEVGTSAARVVGRSEDDSDDEPAQILNVLAEKRKAFGAFHSRLPQRVVQSIENFQSHQWKLA